jgi:hypothetical protein
MRWFFGLNYPLGFIEGKVLEAFFIWPKQLTTQRKTEDPQLLLLEVTHIDDKGLITSVRSRD